MFNSILIIGSGVMGQGVATLLLSNKLNVTQVVRNLETAKVTQDNVMKALTKLARRTKVNIDFDDVTSRFNVVTELSLNSKFDLVFEAIVESIDAKKSIIKKYDDYITAETIWATNTSSLSITDMAASYSHPEKFIGLHFFNPVANMELVEVIPSMLTSEDTVSRCWDFCIQVGKSPVRVEDSPGFIVNRLLIPMINEAVGILESRVATVEEIDSAMKLGAHHPLGPLALADLIGNDVCLSIMNALYSSTCDSKYRPSYLLQKMVSANKLGRKSGQGFYTY
ncbi:MULTISPECIES: 3-hydroxyacyl-CoA dehydrogenase family protein [Shewanella]|uniref:3-hydroxyacyl-CoA dehydrogenase family protein n=1 Tax=Shewanella TaxID=22 RepID=UPI0021D98D58|nr:3-hydroxyacyl-CoA dehydrogenase NAD-binding domain-containing protein [Shewanella sp. SM87]MCU8006059.1 3-hydroxyacyl-CoA dehydrogenase NAD-binding domain-containing protein [Shewanella sp. SM87]